MTDILVEGHGSIFMFRPLTDEGEEWLKTNTSGEWFGDALAVEWRYADDIAQGARCDGLVVD